MSNIIIRRLVQHHIITVSVHSVLINYYKTYTAVGTRWVTKWYYDLWFESREIVSVITKKRLNTNSTSRILPSRWLQLQRVKLSILNSLLSAVSRAFADHHSVSYQPRRDKWLSLHRRVFWSLDGICLGWRTKFESEKGDSSQQSFVDLNNRKNGAKARICYCTVRIHIMFDMIN